ncbi:hypothetical protein ASD21_15925 [Caulobacter sp. Root1455]|uniref:hypothetical protein n=1 Tax=Caulobacter sp. Root1455 TaxID=1736465 RepID=UPI0006F94BCA|nr:hypothetical protein [Caulobacter sp. Root1455]KQY91797.1 hypothetical protein ASD21_15925 [Caulobacter sp. Root1455]
MNLSEQQALTYLESLGLGPVVFEPDGQTTPDFAIGDIAIEVRRLNQHHEGLDGYDGLEDLQHGLIRFIENLLPTFGPAPDRRGWWVTYDFRRPIDGKRAKRELPAALAAFQAAPAPGGAELVPVANLRLEIAPASIPVDDFYMLGGFVDYDAGGFVAAEILRNLNLCITEKAKKIAPSMGRYREWWLVLPDHIGPDLNADERARIGDDIDLKCFSRVVLIHPRDPARALTLGG